MVACHQTFIEKGLRRLLLNCHPLHSSVQILASAQQLEEEAEWTFAMKASFIEVYNQGLRDLLSKSAEMPDNAIKHDAHGGHTVVQGGWARP